MDSSEFRCTKEIGKNKTESIKYAYRYYRLNLKYNGKSNFVGRKDNVMEFVRIQMQLKL